MALSDVLAALARDEERSEEVKGRERVDPEAAVARLSEAGRRFAEAMQGPRFPVGAWVTPASDSAYRGAGDPHLVVEVRDGDDANRFRRKSSSNGFGRRLDTRVLSLPRDGKIMTIHWVESAYFVPWGK